MVCFRCANEENSNFCLLLGIEKGDVMIHHHYFPMQNSASLTVPGGASVACSTATAVAWDESWSKNLDPSGRAAIGVHYSPYEKRATVVANGKLTTKVTEPVARVMETTAPGLTIRS